jgi:hypothetical protein
MPYTQQQTGLSVGIDGSKDTLPIAPFLVGFGMFGSLRGVFTPARNGRHQ